MANAFLDPRNVNRKTRPVSSEQKEFAEIRQKIGLSQARFAAALGVNRDRVVNIENGRIRNVPDELMEIARELLQDSARIQKVERLTSVKMTEILQDWSKQLGIDYGDSSQYDRTMGDLLGLHSNTIYRWRNGTVRPDPETLLELDRLVKIIAERIQPDRLRKALSKANTSD